MVQHPVSNRTHDDPPSTMRVRSPNRTEQVQRIDGAQTAPGTLRRCSKRYGKDWGRTRPRKRNGDRPRVRDMRAGVPSHAGYLCAVRT